MNVVARARKHAERGNFGAAIALLKPLVGDEGPPYEVRRVLAELYRAHGAPDQAGRWGIAIEGWTTPFERDRLARALASYLDPRDFLKLSDAAPEPPELSQVLELRDEHRARAKARSQKAAERWRASPAGRAALRTEAVWTAGAVLLAIGAVGPLLYALGRLMLAREPWAVAAVGAGWGLIALGCLVCAISWRMEGPRRGIDGFTWTGLAATGVAVGLFLLAAYWGAAPGSE